MTRPPLTKLANWCGRGAAVWMLAACASAQVSNDGCYNRWENYKLNCGGSPVVVAPVTLSGCEQACQQRPGCAVADYTVRSKTCAIYEGPNVNMVPPPPGKRRRRRRDALETLLIRTRRGRGRGGHGGRRPPRTYIGGPSTPSGYGNNNNNNRGTRCGGSPTVIRCPGVIHMRPTGTCGGGTPATQGTTQRATTTSTTQEPLPDEVQCESNERPRYVLYEGTEVSGGGAEQVFTARSLDDCLQACSSNTLPDGTQAPCLSAMFSGSSCTLTTNALVPTGSGSAINNPSMDYYEKRCVPVDEYNKCPGPILIDPNHILVGYAETVTDAADFDECFEQCVDSQVLFGFVCSSGMMFYNEFQLNCVLNSETRAVDPALYTEVPDEPVDYFESGCRRSLSRQAVRANDQSALSVGAELKALTGGDGPPPQRSNLLPTGDQWGSWSSCGTKLPVRYRFRQCPQPPVPTKCQRMWLRCSDVKDDGDGWDEALKEQRAAAATQPTTTGATEESSASRSKCTPTERCCALIKADGSKDCSRGTKFDLSVGLTTISCEPDDC